MKSQPSTTIDAVDIIVVGGGMVGAALACALGKSGLRIAVIEGQSLVTATAAEADYDLRVSAITRASQQLFEQLDVWQDMVDERVFPYREMHVWDASGNGSIHFDSAEIGEPDLGHIVENRTITHALQTGMKRYSNIVIHSPAQPQRLTLRTQTLATPGHTRPAVELILADGHRLQASLIIGADGSNSWVRQQAGIAVTHQSYDQHALVTCVRTEKPHRETAWQRFLPTGPLAFLPLAEGWSSIVWSTSPEQAETLRTLPEVEFHAALGEGLANKLGKIEQSGHRASFPLQARHARNYVKPGLALIGDAAHTIHPLAGQGVNLGFADAACLAGHLLTAANAQRPLGGLKTLRRYERSRKGENLLMLESMGVFKTVFSGESTWLRELRNLGLSLTDQTPPLKRWFMQQALGKPDPLPTE